MAIDLLTLAQSYHGENTLLRRVEGACLYMATYIRTAEAPGVENHANRLLWAASVQADPTAMARAMMPRVLENGDIAANPIGASNDTVQYVVDVNVNAFATGA